MSTPVPRPKLPHHLLAYALSIPERLLRGLASLVGGLAMMVARLLPGPIRKGKFYELTIKRQIKMLTDDVGRAELFPDEKALDTRTATRMTIGGAIDNLFVLGMHASPIWILLAATDVTAEAKRFTTELATELKAKGVMKEGSRLDSVEDVLGGLATLSASLADTIDKPPLSLDEMRQTVGSIRSEMVDVTDSTVRTVDVDGLAHDIMELKDSTNRSLIEVTSAVTVGAVRTTHDLVRGTAIGAVSSVKIVGKRVWKDVILDYGDAIGSIYKVGVYGSIRHHLTPHVRGYGRLFAYRFLTMTELILSFGCWRKADWRVGVSAPAPDSDAPAD